MSQIQAKGIVCRIAFLLPTLLVNACGSMNVMEPSQAPTPELADTVWKLVLLDNSLAEGIRPTLHFRPDGRADGTTGCVPYFGFVSLSGEQIRFTDLQVTPEAERRYRCESRFEEQQERFLRALKESRFARVQQERLLLLDAGDRTLALLEREHTPSAKTGVAVASIALPGPNAYASAFPGADTATSQAPQSSRPYAANDPLAGMELVALTPSLGQYFGTQSGVLVTRVLAGNVYGLMEGDVILSINGRQPANGAHAFRILSQYRPGDTLDLQVMRQHQRVQLSITLTD